MMFSDASLPFDTRMRAGRGRGEGGRQSGRPPRDGFSAPDRGPPREDRGGLNLFGGGGRGPPREDRGGLGLFGGGGGRGVSREERGAGGGGGRVPANREERKGNRRAAQQYKEEKKSADEAAYFFQCAKEMENGKRIAEDPAFSAGALFSAGGASGGINFDAYDAITVTRNPSGGPAALTDFAVLFNDASVPKYLVDNVERIGYAKPTPIQKHAIPLIKDGRDVLCAAQTGSGKTFAFLFPLLHAIELSTAARCKARPDGKPILTPARPRILVLAPTRELASQIHLESKKLTFQRPEVRSVCVYGGANARQQLAEMAGGVELLVATPGRLTDFLNRELVFLGDCKYLVLDEADRMLDMGFKPQIERIMKSGLPAREERITCMFSATFPVEIQALAKQFMRPFTYVAVGRVGSTTESITQHFRLVEDYSRGGKTALLLDTLSKEPPGQPTIVFVQKKRTATQVCKALNGIRDHPCGRAVEIHGDRSQSQREAALLSFRTGQARVLVATDVAARGLDIPHVEHVINYDLPPSAEEIDAYVHRIGRTGRAGKTGKATSFFVRGFDPKIGNSALIAPLSKLLSDAGQVVPDFFDKAFKGAGTTSASSSSLLPPPPAQSRQWGEGRGGGAVPPLAPSASSSSSSSSSAPAPASASAPMSLSERFAAAASSEREEQGRAEGGGGRRRGAGGRGRGGGGRGGGPSSSS